MMPSAMLGLDGVIAIDTSVAALTVSVVLPARVPQVLATLQVAVIVVLPEATALASTLLPTVAIAIFEEVQVRSGVKF